GSRSHLPVGRHARPLPVLVRASCVVFAFDEPSVAQKPPYRPPKVPVPSLTVRDSQRARALGSADEDSIRYYTELLEIGLGDTPARATWKELTMVGTFFPGRGTLVEKAFLEGEAKGEVKGKAEGEAKGKALGKAQLITRALRGRGIAVSPETEQ